MACVVLPTLEMVGGPVCSAHCSGGGEINRLVMQSVECSSLP